MKLTLFLTFILTGFGIPLSWGLTPPFLLLAGSKTLEFPGQDIEWSDFCAGKKMGCARFKIQNEKDNTLFGFIKILNDKSVKNDFEQYCKNAFAESLKYDKKLKDYSFKNGSSQSYCSWLGKEEKTFFFLKSDVTFMLTTPEKASQQVLEIVTNKVKIYEK